MAKKDVYVVGVLKAYKDRTEGRYELQRNLMDISRKLTNGYDSGVIMDINGNKVGDWSVE